VAARGIDVDDVEAVFNYDIPDENEYYLHRIGRTGRAKRHGKAFSLAGEQDQFRLRDIRKYTHSDMTELHFEGDALLLPDGTPLK
jgi:ATP-dependent RNA helicase DeaD